MLAFIVYVLMFAIISLIAVRFGRNRTAPRYAPDSGNIRADNAPASLPAFKGKSAHILLVSISMALLARPAWASSGGVLFLPRLAPGEVDKTGGLSLIIDMNWVDSCGYRPLRVELKSIAGPVVADRVLTLRFRPKQAYTRFDSVAVTQVLEIPAGSSSATATLSVPQFGPWGMFEVDAVENGEYVKQLSIGENQGWASWSATTKGDAASPVVLLLSGADTMTGQFMLNNPGELFYVQPDNATATIDPQIVNSAPNLGLGNPVTGLASSAPTLDQLPTRWIDYTGFDVMIVSLDKLQTLIAKHPAQWSAIRDWLHNGGNLFFYGVGKKWEKLDDVERLLGVAEQPKGEANGEIDLPARGWQLPREALRRVGLLDASGGDGSAAVGEPQTSVVGDTDNGAVKRPADAVRSDQARSVTRRCGLGMVAAIASTDQFDRGETFPWKWLYNTIGALRWQWPARYGTSIYGTNDSFWNFLIPGVGLVPVTSFQILITLFVVVIGPVNYYLLRRWGKLNLTVLTVPTGALFLTAALLLYALVSDGLSVRLRARSMTHIDQRRRSHVLVAALVLRRPVPAGGIVFSEDTAVVPLEAQPLASTEGGPRRAVDWTRTDPSQPNSPLEQRLSEGWLNLRTPTQLITARIRKSAAGLKIQPASAGKPLRVENHLGTVIYRLLLIDDDGKPFTASSIPDNAMAKFDETASPNALLPLLAANEPQVPIANAEVGRGGFFGLNRRRPYYQGGVYAPAAYIGPNSPAYAAVPPSGGNLERSFSEINQRIATGDLPPRTYIAVVERSPEFQPGTSLAKEEASFHVVVGTW